MPRMPPELPLSRLTLVCWFRLGLSGGWWLSDLSRLVVSFLPSVEGLNISISRVDRACLGFFRHVLHLSTISHPFQ